MPATTRRTLGALCVTLALLVAGSGAAASLGGCMNVLYERKLAVYHQAESSGHMTPAKRAAWRRYLHRLKVAAFLAALPPPPPPLVPPGATTTGDGVPCDGPLTPCWRVRIESGGTWNAYNPTGCSGTGCFGPYQFGGFWANKLGLPSNLWNTTHAQWVEADRELWNNGAGCSNWPGTC